MARKNVVSVTTNVTPEQLEKIEHVRSLLAVDMSHLVRMALAQFIERNNGEWPTAEIKRGARAHTTNIEVAEN